MFLLILTLKYVFAIINRIFYYRLEFQQNKEKSQAGWGGCGATGWEEMAADTRAQTGMWELAGEVCREDKVEEPDPPWPTHSCVAELNTGCGLSV